jgi:hypothetical protein
MNQIQTEIKKRSGIIADNICHSANRRIPHEVFHLDALAYAVESNRLHFCVTTNFTAELDAVGESLLRV